MFSSVTYFIHSINSAYVNPSLPSSSHHAPFPLGIYTIVLYIRVSISVLQIGSALEGMMLKLKLQYFGHLMRRVDSLEKTDAGKDWGQEEKGTTEDEMAGWHH